MRPNGRGIRVGRNALTPTPNGLLSTVQCRARSNQRGAPGHARGWRNSQRRGRSTQARSAPIPADLALERLGADTETATLSAAVTRTDEPSPAALSSTRTGWTPPAIAIRTITGSAAASQFAYRTRPVAIMPRTISTEVRRVASSKSRLLRSRSEAMDGAASPATPIASKARVRTTMPNDVWPNQAAPSTDVLSQPHRSQNKTQPATTRALTVTATTRSGNTFPARTRVIRAHRRNGESCM